MNQTEITGIKKISVKSDFSPEDNSVRHTLSLSVEVGEEDVRSIRMLEHMKGTWTLTLTVETAQLELPDVITIIPESKTVTSGAATY